MADEELHETDSNNQKDWQSETSSSTVADETASKDTEQNAENASAEEGAAYGVNMEQVQAVLNATADKATLTPQMQRMMNRQAENTKRVEETIKGTKSNPRWFVPLFCAFMIIDLIWFTIGGKKALGEAGKTPFKKDAREFVSEEKRAAAAAPLTTGDKKKVVAVILLTLLSAVFWMLWYMAYMPAYYRFGYGDGDAFLNKANWYIGSFQIPTSWFDSVNALVCIILGPVLAMVWRKLSQRPQGDMSMFRKTALGCILLGVSYVVMVVANNIAGDNGQCSVMWLALVCLLMAVGEMVFSPLGNSFISKFAPAKLLGLLLGVWPIAVFLAQQLYPRLYAFLNTMDFTKGYGGCAVVVIVFGAILWGFSNKLESWGTSEE